MTLKITQGGCVQEPDVRAVPLSRYPELERLMAIWSSDAEKKCQSMERGSQDYERVSDCGMICGQINALLGGISPEDPVEIYTCQDSQGIFQAMMSTWIDSDVTIMHLVSNPWNIVPEQYRESSDMPIKGGGSSLVMQAMSRAIQLKKRAVRLKALPCAMKFYQKLGFDLNSESKDKHTGEMILTAEKICTLYPHLSISKCAA